jgi:hypothetical protein
MPIFIIAPLGIEGSAKLNSQSIFYQISQNSATEKRGPTLKRAWILRNRGLPCNVA